MILNILTEAKLKTYPEIVSQLKAKDEFFAKLIDATINDIIRVYLKDVVVEGEINPDDIIDWFYQGLDTWDFIYNYASDLSTYTIYNLIKADPELTKYIKEYAYNLKYIDKNGKDLIDPYSNSIMSLQDIVSWIFRWPVSSPVYTTDDLDKLVAKTLKDNPGMKSPEAMDKIYNSPRYGEKTEMNPVMLQNALDDLDYFIKNGELKELTPEEVKDRKEKELAAIDKILKPLDIKEAKEEDEDIPEEDASIEFADEPVEVLPEEEPVEIVPEEEITVKEPIEEVKPEIEESAFSQMILDAIQHEWDLISQINSIIATIDYDYKEDNKDDVLKILNEINDDSTINVGMLHKVSELISEDTANLLSSGIEKAEEIINQ